MQALAARRVGDLIVVLEESDERRSREAAGGLPRGCFRHE